jgi:hypothetical protein
VFSFATASRRWLTFIVAAFFALHTLPALFIRSPISSSRHFEMRTGAALATLPTSCRLHEQAERAKVIDQLAGLSTRTQLCGDKQAKAHGIHISRGQEGARGTDLILLHNLFNPSCREACFAGPLRGHNHDPQHARKRPPQCSTHSLSLALVLCAHRIPTSVRPQSVVDGPHTPSPEDSLSFVKALALSYIRASYSFSNHSAFLVLLGPALQTAPGRRSRALTHAARPLAGTEGRRWHG